MYWPGTGLSTNNGLFNGTAVNAVVDNLASWFNVFSTAAFPVVVLSQTGSSTAVVTAVDADLVPDTMRRRRNKLTSTRHSATV